MDTGKTKESASRDVEFAIVKVLSGFLELVFARSVVLALRCHKARYGCQSRRMENSPDYGGRTN